MFGNSPDETAYCRLVLNRETVPDALVMIQPTLLAYSLDAPPQPVRPALNTPAYILPYPAGAWPGRAVRACAYEG